MTSPLNALLEQSGNPETIGAYESLWLVQNSSNDYSGPEHSRRAYRATVNSNPYPFETWQRYNKIVFPIFQWVVYNEKVYKAPD
jgi:hypothetical protein